MADPKIHRAGADGNSICGKRPKGGELGMITEINEKVTCGLCHHSMHGSWGIPLPEGTAPRRGGRKPGSLNKKDGKKLVAGLRAGLLERAAEHRSKADRLDRVAEDLKEDV